MSDNAKKPRDGYPDVHTWLAPCPNGCNDDWWPKAAA